MFMNEMFCIKHKILKQYFSKSWKFKKLKMQLQNDFGYIVRSRGDLGGYGNEILFLFNSLVKAKGQIISEQNWVVLNFPTKSTKLLYGFLPQPLKCVKSKK